MNKYIFIVRYKIKKDTPFQSVFFRTIEMLYFYESSAY